MNRDLQLKTLTFTTPESTISGITRFRNITITEKDIIDIKFKRSTDTNILNIKGEVIKIGIDDDNRKYITILAYNYSEENVYKIHLDEIVLIVNINHSIEPYSFSPVYNPDETAIMIKAENDTLFFSHDGETWLPAGGVVESPDGGKTYQTSGTLNESTSSSVIPTGNVVYNTIVNMIPSDLFDECVVQGWTGSKAKLAKALVSIASNADRLFTAYYSAEDYERNLEDSETGN